ncbi:MAG: DUF4351 domain-containing protein [Cyanobacteria bacterium J06648_11]
MQAIRRDPQERKRWKLALTGRFGTQGYARRYIVSLYRFIEWMVALTELLELEYRQDIEQLEREGGMPYISTIERLAEQRDLEQGIEQGLARGWQSLILRQLARRFGEVPEESDTRIESLSLEDLEQLGEALLDFDSVEDRAAWFETHRGRG